MGAWIETPLHVWHYQYFWVAPYVGAWIETFDEVILSKSERSHPMWVRGLKPSARYIRIAFAESHPMWVRGLKHCFTVAQGVVISVAPYVGAWIETLKIRCYYKISISRTLCGCVD